MGRGAQRSQGGNYILKRVRQSNVYYTDGFEGRPASDANFPPTPRGEKCFTIRGQ
jgi:hypothetical protein